MRLNSKRAPLFLSLLALAAASIGACDRQSSRPLPEANPAPLVPGNSLPGDGDKDQDPPEVAIGQRLFRETRFSQFFAAHFKGNVNTPLESGDPRFETLETPRGRIPNPYAGSGVNCASCHLVGEVLEAAGSRAYGDFSRRSPVPDRGDGQTTTLRNAPAFVDSAIPREGGFFLHFDAEFATVEDLVRGGFTGRNFGWLPQEKDKAVAHIARVVREDDGSGKLAREYGGSYAVVLGGTDPSIAPKFRIPAEFRIDVARATDTQILDALAKLVGAYIRSIQFKRDENGEYDGTPYDLFLKKNSLPRKPKPGETAEAYSARLLGAVEGLAQPVFVNEGEGSFKYHDQKFVFGERELEGMKVFFRRASAPNERRESGVGNCVACHAAPSFTDFSFHNTGASQEEYESIHGQGSFLRIPIPSYAERNRLFSSPQSEEALSRFKSVPEASRAGACDLGLWNVLGNPSIPAPQAALLAQLCKNADPHAPCDVSHVLPRALAAFKTPTVRDLGQSAPYFHTGRMATIEDAVAFYQKVSEDTRKGRILNPDPELARIKLQGEDLRALASFLRSLNEDYD